MTHFTRPLTLLALVCSAATGCVVYEHEHDRHDGYDEGYTYEDGEDSGDVEATPELALGFFPDQAEQGESFLGYLTVAEGELDFEEVESVTFYGDIEVLDFDARGDEIIVSVSVAPDAIVGGVDILIETKESQAIWAEGLFTVYEAGSGHSCDDAEEDDDEGGGLVDEGGDEGGEEVGEGDGDDTGGCP